MESLRFIELLAPAKDLQSAVAAIDYGADAVYMGAPKFGARYAAGNSVYDIARTVEYARRYGVRVYATLNTILFDSELESARRQAKEVISAGVDALIIQDMAYMEMGLTGVEFHASTQTFNALPEKVKFLQEAGFTRVILERNLTLEEIKRIRAASSVELEIFVHGAICVCHSGRCYMSRTMGPRSGNRGECSQPCRLTYDLLESNAGGHLPVIDEGRQYKTLISGKHLLSVQDLDLSGRIGDLLDAGISSFKIEGRLKDLNYVKNTVLYYRRQLDEEMAGRKGLRRASAGTTLTDLIPDLSKTFTRGRSEYFTAGKRRGVASFDTPKALGEYIGNVTASGKGWLETDGGQSLSPGDGICFFKGGELVGTNVNKAEGKRIFTNKALSTSPGTGIYRNYDHLFSSALENSHTRRIIYADATINIDAGKLTLTVSDEEDISATTSLQGLFDPAENPVKAEQTIRSQLGKTGDTIFQICNIDINAQNGMVFIPASTLNSLRRDTLDKLLGERLSMQPERNIPIPNPYYLYPSDTLPPTENVTNSLAERFYRQHGVKEIVPGLDTREHMHGEVVMRTPYCIRRETGRCVKKGPDGNTDLFLSRGTHHYRLRFDCKECMMEIIFE